MKERKTHKLKIYTNLKGESYFIFNNLRYYLKDLIYNNKRVVINSTNCFTLSYKVKFEYDINDYIILYDKLAI